MAEEVEMQTRKENVSTAIFRFTNVSDGTGESAVTKIDVSALAVDPVTGAACTKVSIEKIQYTTVGMGVKILFDASSDVLAWQLKADDARTFDFTDFTGIPNNAGSGVTGDIQFSTVSASSGNVYVIVMQVRKHF